MLDFPRFAPCQEVWRPLTHHQIEEMSAFVTDDGRLGLWDGEAAWLSFWGEDGLKPHLRSGDARLCIKATSKPEWILSSQDPNAVTWALRPGAFAEVPRRGEGAAAILPTAGLVASSVPVRSVRREPLVVALTVSGDKARAMLWKLPTKWDRDLRAPSGYFFTGKVVRAPFAVGAQTTVEAEILGIRDGSGAWNSTYRLWLGGRLCSFQSDQGEETLFTFGGGLPRRSLPATLCQSPEGRAEWNLEYVEAPGWISRNAIDRFALDLVTAQGKYSHSTWEEH